MVSTEELNSTRNKEREMKTYLVVGIVVAAHCLAVGSVFLIQGCGTLMATDDDEVMMEPTPVVMPPSAEGDPRPATVLVPPSAGAGPVAGPVSTEMITYVIKKGDSLSAIAHRHGLSVAQVATLNGIKNPNLIRVGQRLLLPSGGRKTAPPAPRKAAPKKVRVGSGGSYVVRKGDSLSRIAFEHGTTVAALKEANGLTRDLILAGQELVIPGGVTRRKAPAPAVELKPPAPEEPDITVRDRVPAVDARVEELKLHEEVKSPPRKAAPMKKRIVQEGETLEEIAQQWGLSAEELRRVNNLGDGPVRPGQELKIPLGEF